MEFTIEKRKKLYKSFINRLEKELENNSDYTKNLQTTKNCNYMTMGLEGKIYKCEIKTHKLNFIIKLLNLRRISDSKGLYKIYKYSVSKIYNYFLSKNIFNKPTFTELISYILTNRLVFQKICPHFVLNYYWDLSKSIEQGTILKQYNEYINCCTLDEFLKKSTYDYDTCTNILFQLMVSLYSLKKYYGMLHTDFHLGNILVQTITPGGYWKYIIDGNTYYLPNLGFQLLLNDFGFAWIPNKLYIKWHRDTTLKYITKIGMEFYDLSKALRYIFFYNKINQPHFIKLIKTNFIANELNYVLSKDYYINNDSKLVNNYPDISKRFSGNKMTLSKKIHTIFYEKYNTKQLNIIDKFSLDKNINKNKLPKNLQKLIL
jgi:hypothetical protein